MGGQKPGPCTVLVWDQTETCVVTTCNTHKPRVQRTDYALWCFMQVHTPELKLVSCTSNVGRICTADVIWLAAQTAGRTGLLGMAARRMGLMHSDSVELRRMPFAVAWCVVCCRQTEKVACKRSDTHVGTLKKLMQFTAACSPCNLSCAAVDAQATCIGCSLLMYV